MLLRLNTLDVEADCRGKAKACRELAELATDPERKAMWIRSAENWERRAAKARKQKELVPDQ
jgi:hypothetical protein